MLQRYSLRLRIYSWFMKYLPPQLESAGVIAAFPVVTLVGANNDLFFSVDPVFNFAIYMIQVWLIHHALPWAPHIAITRIRMKTRQVKCLGKDTYTLSDLRESNEELSKVYFENLLKKPQATWHEVQKWFDSRPFHASTTQNSVIDTSKFTSTRYGLEYLLCLLHTFENHVLP